MKVEVEELNRALSRFSGRKIDLSNESEFKQFSLGFFSQNTDPFFHANIKLDLTEIYQNYKLYYKIEGSSFNAFMYYHLIKTMQQPKFSPFRYRSLNNQWYCFDNLPFYVSVSVDKESGQQLGFFIERSAHMSWRDFVSVYRNEIKKLREMNREASSIEELSWYGISHQITSMVFPFSSYTPSLKCPAHNAEAPWFVVGQREENNGDVGCTLSCSVSHSSGLPSDLAAFKEAFIDSLSVIPKEQQITNYFTKAVL